MPSTKPIINHLMNKVQASIKELFGVDIDVIVEFAPIEKGDFTVQCFQFSKTLKKSGQEIAKTLVGEITSDEMIESLTTDGPYLNFRIKSAVLFGTILNG